MAVFVMVYGCRSKPNYPSCFRVEWGTGHLIKKWPKHKAHKSWYFVLQKSWRWMESTSIDTQENAQNTWAMLEKEGIKKIVLVTSHVHMQRSVAQFQKVGFEVMPAPTGKFSPSGSALLDALPFTGGLQNSRQVLHEWLGILVTVQR
ncbi:MAG: YdcF family protein [Limnohabitans sp.]|nr:YdcF family protein [Limnohabitans sp.]